MEGLKACPFCGGNASMKQTGCNMENGGSAVFGFSIRCDKCGACSYNFSGSVGVNLANGEVNVWRDDRQKAIEEWNRMAVKRDE